ncbi:metal ABC transporter permease [Canibacter sp. lx-72]|uniref:metal ABC transporter permease n=1 Tax=Canibacter zhuwentaonis TaxID=2837491 RepID=UPI001BDCD8A7|nr:metal ABC transporter permease [Canibacter zhuwentaonis]MBT1018760.1 metal ABC transporter permease [Canibacter zhuwentaonis]
MLEHGYFTILFATVAIGAATATVGSLVYLRQQGMFADVVAHSTLPGTMLAFLAGTALFENGRNIALFTVFAICFGILGTRCASAIKNRSPLGIETAMAITIVSFFSGGMLLFAYIQQSGFAGKGGISSYLFGNAAQLTLADTALNCGVALLSITLVCVFFRPLKLLCFDASYATTRGIRTRGYETLLFVLLALITVSGMRAIGIILIIAFILIPAAAARQWCRTAWQVTCLAAALGAVTAGLGSLITIYVWDAPTGPVIVLLMFAELVFSLLFAPGRGILNRAILHRARSAKLSRTGNTSPARTTTIQLTSTSPAAEG